MTYICVCKLNIMGSDNGLSPGRRPPIIWTDVAILLIRTSGTNFSEFLSEINAFSFKKMHSKMSSAKWRPFCLGLNVLIHWCSTKMPAISQPRAQFFLQKDAWWFAKCVGGFVRRVYSSQWSHNGHDGASNHQPHDCLINFFTSADQRKHQSSASLAFVWGIHRGPAIIGIHTYKCVWMPVNPTVIM